MKRTHIEDYKKIDKASDLDKVVKDKRKFKRADKKKAKRRNRHYERSLLRHLTNDYPTGDDE